MRSSKIIHTVSCHAEGEVGDVITGGVAPPPGDTLWDMRAHIAADDQLRQFILNEPRGGVFRHVNLLVPPTDPAADAAFIIMEPEDTPPMSGSNSICVSTVLLDTGIVPMTEPETHFTLQAPGGLVPVRASCKNGKAQSITVTNLPSFAAQLDAPLEVAGHGTLTVDTAFGGDSFVVVDTQALGFSMSPDEAHDLACLGTQISDAATAQLGFTHPTLPDWQHISFCLFTTPVTLGPHGPQMTSTVAIRPGKLDRSPCGTGVSAKMALLHARGQMQVGDTLRANSIIGGLFVGKITDTTNLGGQTAITPEITGRAWVTGTHQHMLDPADPWPNGYRLTDTWGAR